MENVCKVRRSIPATAICGEVLTWNDIPKYLDETFYSALEKWYYTKTWGLANGKVGWANEPKAYIDAITVIENEKNKVEAEEMEAHSAKMREKSGK